MLPAYMTRAAIAAAKYGPTVYKYGKRALSAGAFAAGMREQFRGRKRQRTGPTVRENPRHSTSVPAAVRKRGGGAGPPYVPGRKRSYKRAGTRKRTSKRFKKRKSVVNYVGKGASATDEITGTVTDPDLCYLYVHDTAPDQTYKTVAEALVRKLFEKAFMKSFSSSYELLLSGQNIGLGAIKYQLRYQYMNMHTIAITLSNLSIDQNSTIDNVAAQLIALFETVGMGDGTAKVTNTNDFTNMWVIKNIYDAAGATVVDSIILSQLNLQEEIVHLKVDTIVKVQNRSVGADGSADENNVNMTPLEMINYRFSGIPKHKYSINGPSVGSASAMTGGHEFSQLLASTGHNTVRAAVLTAYGGNGNNWLKAQTKSNFINCKSAKGGVLVPGGMYSFQLHYSKALPFNSYLKKIMKRDTLIVGLDLVSDTVGGGNMLAFQDAININTTYNLTLTWQIDRETKACLVSRKKATWEKKFATQTFTDS